jgi:hypothetical protein
MPSTSFVDFEPPRGYTWAQERGIIGQQPTSALEPWFYLAPADIFDPDEKWSKQRTRYRLVAFARRYDQDAIACFAIADRTVQRIVVIQGWTSDGYDVVAEYATYWEWLKSVIDDIADWVA